MKLGDEIPDFEADSTEGKIKFHKWMKNSWAILFSHPADFTPVCTTELGRVAHLIPEFTKRNIKVIALSCDSVEAHKNWIKDILAFANVKEIGYPIISDPKCGIAKQLGMIDPFESELNGMPTTCRAVFVIDDKKRMRLSILYPATTGRNFDEILRAVDSLLLTEKFKVATPADWKVGEKCMVQPSVPDEKVDELFPKGVERVTVPSGKNYIRLTPQP